jgi:hypothetical protein
LKRAENQFYSCFKKYFIKFYDSYQKLFMIVRLMSYSAKLDDFKILNKSQSTDFQFHFEILILQILTQNCNYVKKRTTIKLFVQY